MSTAAAATAAAVPDAAASAQAPAKKGKKKLIIIIAVAVLVLAAGGAGAMLLLKKKPHEGDADAEHSETSEHGATAGAGVVKPAERPAPVFVPLEPFTVNLADRDAERYAQVGITLEVEDAHIGEQIKLYMPAIRNHFLLAIADNTATDLLAREGKLRLGEKLRREAARALGYTVPEMAAEPAPKDAGESDDAKPKTKKKKSGKKEELDLPVRAVQFSNFIIQ
ncbi:MAG: flagellar basal body-associated FliL family protein [Pseudomonadota bacterium]|nr:flagellar basal body-associated FliL family protein [Pseudomonadota bacterium]